MIWYNGDDWEGYYGPTDETRAPRIAPRKDLPMYDVIVDVVRQDRSAHEYRESRACNTKEEIAAFLGDLSGRIAGVTFDTENTEDNASDSDVSDEDQDVIDNL